MARSPGVLSSLELPGWKTALNWLGAVFISLLFLSAGIWKITDAPGAAARLAQARVPESLSLAAALVLGVLETVAAVLILVPRFRRWGAWLASLLLIAFLIYIGLNYQALHGQECNCFPWIKRAVGPGFFLGDALMLAMALIAGLWARPAQDKRTAALILAAVSVFALVSYGVAATHHSEPRAPFEITVDGKAFSMQRGRIFIYFFNPECMHCIDAAKRLASLNWGDTKVVGVATEQPRFAQEFMESTGLKGGISRDVLLLRKSFSFVDPPAGVAIEDGRVKKILTQFEGDESIAALKNLRFAS